MSYDTLYFALFLAATWAAFMVLPWRGYVLLVASIAFYAVAGVRASLLAAAIILVNYAFQFPIMRDRRWLCPRRQREQRCARHNGVHALG